MYALIIKQFLRSRAVVMTLAILLLIGMVSIVVGKHFLIKQETAVAQVTDYQESHIARNVKYNDNNIGLLLYYLRFTLINKPDKLAALSIGQRDVNPSIQSVTIRNLEAQKYDTDLNNPMNLLSGNLDLGFVIIYLFPLAIIAFTFNILSEECESGTWKVVAIQAESRWHFLVQKLSARALLIYVLVLLLFTLGISYISLPLNQSLIAFILLTVLYLAFWFSIALFIVSLNRSSSFNALVLLATWVVLAILLPATVNNYVASHYPVPESFRTMLQQRDGYHEKWDVDKQVTMNKFYEHYPQFKNYTIPEAEFSYAWYYAMQQMGDDESLAASKAMRDKIMQREELSRLLAMVIPTMHAQLVFNDIARTSLQDHLQFLDHTDDFHEKKRLYFYPKIFENLPVENVDWSKFKPEYMIEQPNFKWLTMVLPTFLLTIFISALAFLNLKNLRAV